MGEEHPNPNLERLPIEMSVAQGIAQHRDRRTDSYWPEPHVEPGAPPDTTYIYGDLWDSFVFIPENRVIERERMLRAAREATTWGEFRAWLRMISDEVYEQNAGWADGEIEDDEPFDVEQMPGIEEGDWPPWLHALRCFGCPWRSNSASEGSGFLSSAALPCSSTPTRRATTRSRRWSERNAAVNDNALRLGSTDGR
jgi:hypothetical protein